MEGKKVLIVDDDVDFVEAVKLILESKGLLIDSAHTVKTCMEKLEKNCPDVLILDVMIEKMSDGIDLARKLKRTEQFKNIPIFMLTAIGNKVGFEFTAEAGDREWLPVDDYAEKPLSPEDLASRVSKLIGA